MQAPCSNEKYACKSQRNYADEASERESTQHLPRQERMRGPFKAQKSLAASLRIAPMRLHSERSNRIMFMHFERAADSLVIVLEGHLSIYLLLLDNYLEGSPFLHLSEALA